MSKPCDSCSGGCLVGLPAELQPIQGEAYVADGVWIKQIVIPKAGTHMAQHSHVYDHTTMVATGRVLVWIGHAEPEEHAAPTGIFIQANVKHRFVSVEDNTILYCVHKLHGTDDVEIAEEHELEIT